MNALYPILITFLVGAPKAAPPTPPVRKTRPARKAKPASLPRRIIHPRPAPPRPRAPVAKDKKKSTGTPWPSRIGPFRLVSQNGKNALTLSFAGQLQGEQSVADVGGDDPVKDLAPKLRRIRLILKGSFLSGRLKYAVQLSTAPNSLEIMDFNLEVRFHRHLRLRMGQYKIPFTSYREGSFKSLTVVDWSILVPAFGSERQLGTLDGTPDGLTDPQYGAVVWVGEILVGDGATPAPVPEAALALTEPQRQHLLLIMRLELIVHATGLMFFPHGWIDRVRAG